MIQTLHGVVGRVQNYGEADRIVEVLTQEEGKVAFLARGARSSRRRFGGVLDLFVSLCLQAVPRPNLWTLQSAEAQSLRVGIRSNLTAYARASALCECVRILAPLGQCSNELLTAFEMGLNHLDRGEWRAAINVYPDLLMAAGIMPEAHVLGFPCVDEAATERAVLAWVEHQSGIKMKTRHLTPAQTSIL